MLPAGYLTGLEQGRYSSAYLRRLSAGLACFRQWLGLHGPRGVLITRAHRRHLDGALSLFVDFCHSTGLPFDTAKHGVLAVQRLLHLKGGLPRAWDCLKAWTLELPISHRLPLPLDILKAMFAVCLDLWFACSGPGLLLPLAVLMRVGFFALLRPGEICALRCMDVLVKDAGTETALAIVVVRRPKNRASLGRQQFSVVRDPATVS